MSDLETLNLSAANDSYVKGFNTEVEGRLAQAPSRRLVIVTCMDARINPYEQLGINLGEAHIVRNAGGFITDDVQRSVVLSQTLGTRRIAIFHHTDCGAIAADQHLAGHPLEVIVRNSVIAMQDTPGLAPDSTVTGWIHNVTTGSASRVV